MIDRRNLIGSAVAGLVIAGSGGVGRLARAETSAKLAKYLWVYQGDDIADIIASAHAMDASGVVVWTTKKWLARSIRLFNDAGLAVWAWRRPGTRQAASKNHHGLDDECDYVTGELIAAGLAGYILDAEGRDDCPRPGSTIEYQSDDWDAPGTVTAARRFAARIKTAGKQANPQFIYGVTGSCREPRRNPCMPFAELIDTADAIYPQCYWGSRKVVGKGRQTPEEAYRTARTDWSAHLRSDRPFLPMAGTLATATSDELLRYGALVRSLGLSEAHFWCYVPNSAAAGQYRAIAGL